jgi:alanyl aminopeptidase
MKRLLRIFAFVLVPHLGYAQEATPPKLKLPDQVRPLRYAVDLEIKPEDPGFRGAIDIEISVDRPTAVVWLNARFLTVERATIGGQRAEIIAGGDDFVGLRAEPPLQPSRTSLHVEYRGQMSDRDTVGVFRQREGADWYAYTQFESIFARRAFPCFDEPGYKVPWRLSLTIHEEHIAVSNTPVASETALPGGMKKVSFADTPPLPSYLVAFGVGPFDVVDAGRAGRNATPLRIIVPRGMSAQAGYAAKVTGRLLELSEEFTGVPYPYAKLDSLTLLQRGQFGAMENVGLITYALPLILARPQDETPRFRQGYAHTASHEIAHMWFGNLVTHAWWDDIWLNESFATWMSDRVIERFEPSWNIAAKSVHDRNWAMKTDGQLSARRIRQPIESNDDIFNAFDPITYAKGGAVLGMFENWMGEAHFRAALQAYLGRHANGNATAADFLAALSEIEPQAGRAFESFLDQPGLPLVSIELLCSAAGAVARLSQRRYLPIGSAGSSAQTWQMPVCLRHRAGGNDRRTCFLLKSASADVPLGKACPVRVRAESPRYYRTDYRRLAPWLDGAPLAEQVAAIGDLDALARNGAIPLDRALSALQRYAAHDNRDVVQALIWSLTDLRAAVPEAGREGWQRWMQKLFAPKVHALGLAARPADSDDTLRLRPALISIVASDGADAKLRSQVSALSKRWLDDRASIPDANLAEAIVQAAARNGDREFFDRLRGALASTKDRRERRILYLALGSFTNQQIAGEALSLILDPANDYREAVQIAWTESDTPQGAVLVHAFAKANFDGLVAAAPRDAASFYPSFARNFCSEAGRADVEDFYRERAPRYEGGPRILAQTLERISLCAALKDRQQDRLAAFLRQQ